MKRIILFIFLIFCTLSLPLYAIPPSPPSSGGDVTGMASDGSVPFTGVVETVGVEVKNGADSSGFVDFYEDSSNGSSYFRLYGPEALAGNIFMQLPPTAGATGGSLYFSAANKLAVAAAGTENQLWIMGATIPGWAAVPTWNQNTTGTAAALAANGANCDAGSAPLGVNASGAAESCFAVQPADPDLTYLAGFTPSDNVKTILNAANNAAIKLALTYYTAGDVIQTGSNTSLPGTCTVGQLYIDTDADTDGSLYICVATNTWKEVDDDGGAASFDVTSITGQTDDTTPATTATAVLAQSGSLIESTLAQIATAIGVVDWTADQGATNIHAGNVVIPVPTTITVADTTDTTSYVGLFESATGDLGPKTDGGITYNAGTGMLTVTGLTAGTGGVTVSKQSGVAGDMSVYEANSTDTHGAGFRGPASITGDGAYRILFPDARASSANMVLAVTNAGESGDGAAATPYVQTGSWIDLDDKAPVANPVFTGVVDVPVNATTDAEGEWTIDTTSDQVRFYGAAQKAIPSLQYASFVIPAPVDTDDILIMKAPYGMVITAVNCIVQGTTSITGQLQECTSAGASCADTDTGSDIVCDADGAADDGTLANNSIDSGDWIMWKSTSASGTPTFLTVTLSYTVVAD
jgi:hypothetical protein